MSDKKQKVVTGAEVVVGKTPVKVLRKTKVGIKVSYVGPFGTEATTTVPWTNKDLIEALGLEEGLSLENLTPGEFYVLEVPDEDLSWIYKYRKGVESHEIDNPSCHEYSLGLPHEWFAQNGRIVDEHDGVSYNIREATSEERAKLRKAYQEETGNVDHSVNLETLSTLKLSDDLDDKYTCKYMKYPITQDIVTDLENLVNFSRLAYINGLSLNEYGVRLSKEGDSIYIEDFESIELPLYTGDCYYVGCLYTKETTEAKWYFTSDGVSIISWSLEEPEDLLAQSAMNYVEQTILTR